MYIKLLTSRENDTDFHRKLRDTTALNIVYSALFLCPRPLTPEAERRVAPLPFKGSPLMLPSVYVGLSLGIPLIKLKAIVPRVAYQRCPHTPYKEIIRALVKETTAEELTTHMSSFAVSRCTQIMYLTDHIFASAILDRHIGATRQALEVQLGERLSGLNMYIADESGHMLTTLIDKHKKLTMLPDKMPSRKAREIV